MTNSQLQLRKVSDGRTWALTGELLVGREPPADVLLTEGHCSRRHARLFVNAEGVSVEDLRSSNGTYVNGLRIDSKVPLRRGDKVRFDTEEFVIDEPPDPNATKVRSSDRQQPAAEPRQEKAPPTPPSRPAPPRSGEKIVEPQNKTVQIAADDLRKFLPQARIPAGAHAADGVATLRVTTGAGAGREFRLTRNGGAKGSWSVGSDPGRDIRLTDSGVSGLHARIENEGEKWKVIDEMSANGTLVNGRRSPMSYLRNGDIVQFGPVVCLLQLPKGGVAAGSKGTGAPRNTKVWVAVAISFLATLLLLYLLNRILG